MHYKTHSVKTDNTIMSRDMTVGQTGIIRGIENCSMDGSYKGLIVMCVSDPYVSPKNKKLKIAVIGHEHNEEWFDVGKVFDKGYLIIERKEFNLVDK